MAKKFSDLSAPKKMQDEEMEKDLMAELGLEDVEDMEAEADMEDMAMDEEAKPELADILADYSREEIEAYLDAMDEEDMDMEDMEDEELDPEDLQAMIPEDAD